MIGCVLGLVAAVLISGVLPGGPPPERELAISAELEARESAAGSNVSRGSRGKDRSAPKPNATPSAAPRSVAGLSRAQTANALVIITVARKRKLPERAALVGMMTAMQETYLRNLANDRIPSSLALPNEGAGRDFDSLGLFQQRSSQGWGSTAELMDPEYATNAFFRSLERVEGWERMSLSQAAQTVQKSAFPDAYAKHEPQARKIIAALT
ncbi:hypothetical protein GCM10010201_02370 [Pilimelia columellifera subsp. columellifera]|uniref:Uncharacterized protein n=2 Tax=Pilimelia TaxID=53370 RepID=A0ABN3MY16_9ACTN